MSKSLSKLFWNAAAGDNAAWYIATKFDSDNAEFFASGAREVDEFLRVGGVGLDGSARLLEIGCGVGRMTGRLAGLCGSVIAADVSSEMLARAAVNLGGLPTVSFLELSGDGDLPLPDASVDAVFSYITMQHVPTAAAQERYFAEAVRVVRPGGWVYMQFRRPGLRARALNWAGHVAHFLRGRKTLSRAWRGAQVAPSALVRAAGDRATVELIPRGRHLWALARVDCAESR
ncbi:ubiquinone/menaquinone biosynthesis C-methylase UbiE [Conyzicola nivalis]|uniref:Ubiquinone/menaquinone biosynthesis C-methylase UbiE n=1 Tax=Conyzicola nivalis TaxID=1477021 RepID=A0ABV2QR18_9MICO